MELSDVLQRLFAAKTFPSVKVDADRLHFRLSQRASAGSGSSVCLSIEVICPSAQLLQINQSGMCRRCKFPFWRFWLAPSIQQQTDASAKWMLIPPQLTLINVTLTTFV